jgi:hypothetical protein
MNPENTNQPMGAMPNPTPQPMPEKKGVGGVVLLVVIILALLLGGYFLMSNMRKAPAMPDNVGAAMPAGDGAMGDSSMVGGDAVDPNTVQGTSINIQDIEKDLNATDLDSLVADLNAI